MASDPHELVQGLKQGGAYSALRSDVFEQFAGSEEGARLKSEVERMVMADIKDNPGLLRSLARGDGSAADDRRITAVFERRVRSEIESGLAGEPIHAFFETRKEQLTREITGQLQVHNQHQKPN